MVRLTKQCEERQSDTHARKPRGKRGCRGSTSATVGATWQQTVLHHDKLPSNGRRELCNKLLNAMSSDKLSNILAARKAQMTTAKETNLSGLRALQGHDSDDDEDDAPTTEVAGGAKQQQPIELLLGRAENMLRSPKLEERKKTIASLEAAELTGSQLKPLLRALLLRFSDESERCRDGAVGLFRRWQQSCADASEVSGALPFLMPVMVERLGSESVNEPSEEVRAALVMLMRDVLMMCRALIRPYIAEVGAIALGCARDKHPEVIKGLCDLIATVSADVLRPLCKETTPKQIRPFSQKILDALLPHITHRHGAVRLQVLIALEELLLCGAGQSVETLTGWRLKNNVPIAEFYGKAAPRINYLADISRDRSVAVRRRFVAVIARWCREMDGEDLYEQEVRIMPYLVSGLCDDDDEVANAARVEIERLGEMYLDKNMKDYKERIEYGHKDELAETRSMTLPPPKPFACRPPLGARERVKQHFRSLIHPICAELEAWTSIERLQSARLCEVLLVYSEGSVTEFVHQLLPALAKAMDPELAGLVDSICRCASQLAQHTRPEEYMPLLAGHATSDPLNPLSSRVQFLQLVPPLLRGCKPHALHDAVAGMRVLLLDGPLITSQHTPLRSATRLALQAAVNAAAAGALAQTGGKSGGVAAALGALGPLLMHALASHLASAPTLQPTVTSVGDGLEDVQDADEDEWRAAATAALAMTRPMSDALGTSEPAGAWGVWKREVIGAIERSGVSEGDEYAPLARKLVQTILDDAAESGVAARAAAKAADGAAPKRVMAISEVDDFSDDDDDAPPPVASATAAVAAVELDEYDEAELD